MSDANDTPAPRRRPWLKIGLIVSLSLNLLFLGLVASAAWMFWSGGAGMGPHAAFAHAVGLTLRKLPEERREKAATSVKTHREALKPLRKKMRAARRSVAEAVKAEPYSEEKLRNALAAMAATHSKIRQSMQEVAIALMAHLNQAERAKFLHYLKKSRWRGRRKRRE